jgi:hypothetical protein
MSTKTKAFIFKGKEYTRYDVETDKADAGWPKTIKSGWPTLPFDTIDASVMWTDGKAYFFKGNQYVRYDVVADKMDAGYPKAISGWNGMPFPSVDAIIMWSNGKVFFFKGTLYARFDIAADKFDADYPKSIKDNWTDLTFDSIDSAVLWENGKAYFFKGDKYVRYDVTADKADEGYPKTTTTGWKGLAFNGIDDIILWKQPEVLAHPTETPTDVPIVTPTDESPVEPEEVPLTREEILQMQAVQLLREQIPVDESLLNSQTTFILSGQTGDPLFNEIINRTDTHTDYSDGGGTSCGFLPHWMLWRLGCTDSMPKSYKKLSGKKPKVSPKVVNRTVDGNVYDIQENLNRLLQCSAYFNFKTKVKDKSKFEDNIPKPGDIILINTDPLVPKADKAHVFVLVEIKSMNHNRLGEVQSMTWITRETGFEVVKGKVEGATAKLRTIMVSKTKWMASDSNPNREVYGWVSLEKLNFEDPPIPFD